MTRSAALLLFRYLGIPCITLWVLAIIILSACGKDAMGVNYKFELDQTTINDRMYPQAFFSEEKQPETDSAHIQELFLPEAGPMLVKVLAKDVVLGRDDSLRISIIHPFKSLVENWEIRPQPDYLLLTDYGQDTVLISFKHTNVGQVTSSTVFRVNRNFYSLNSLDSSRSKIELSKLERRPTKPVVAEMNTRFKNIAVKTLEGRDSLLRYQEGQLNLFYFWTLSHGGEAHLLELNGLLKKMGNRAPHLIAVNRRDGYAKLTAFVEANELEIPVYQHNQYTCEDVDCYAPTPNAMVVGENGNIINHQMSHDELINILSRKPVEQAENK